MTTKTFDSRQYALVALVTLHAADVGNPVKVTLPMGAFLLGVDAVVAAAFDGTAPKLTVSDGTTTFIGGADASAAGAVAATGAPKFYPAGGAVLLTLGGTNATTGELLVAVRYATARRVNENQD